MLNYSFVIFLLTILVIVLSIIVHELGHLTYYRMIRGKWLTLNWGRGKILVGYPKDYLDLSNLEYKRMIMAGVLSGAAPIILWLFANFEEPAPIIAVFIYIIGCKPDLKKLEAIVNEEKETDTKMREVQ